ncbi:MAG: ABC transporter ATP-binding protein [Chloroflexi bacterium]|nr:ABC transporter ATP-binding protein [Chloroflexota bacterium]MCL5074296.1 ABC transporter ATP-binding protein [Chloroflexota bacterium]
MNVIEMRGITKRFGPVVANDHIDLAVRKGEIHALLGENGAGKTTLMNILYGLYHKDSGDIVVNGIRSEIRDASDAIRLKIGMVHQHFMLVAPFTVAENLVLGTDLTDKLLFDFDKAVEYTEKVSKQYGLRIDPKAKVASLSVGLRQRVEILKALYRGAETLILDEPTAVLTPQEIDNLFNVLRQFKAEGKTIIFITHKLKEVMAISDRITVLRRGKVIGTVEKSKTTPRELARMMVGRDILFEVPKREAQQPVEALRIENLVVYDARHLPAVNGVNLSLCRGEILGIAGVEGNGQSELCEALRGLRRASRGCILFCERDLCNRSPREINAAGVAHIPEDRQARGLIPDFTVQYNLILGVHYRLPFAKGFILDHEAIRSYAQRLIAAFDIRTPSEQVQAKYLSGGNQQKLVVAREFGKDPEVVIAVQPTRGLDIGATEYVHQKLVEVRDQGRVVLLISTDLDEIIALSDRIAVIYEGKIMDVRKTREFAREEIGLLMMGKKAAEIGRTEPVAVEETGMVSWQNRGE